jgi:hypothetical protein
MAKFILYLIEIPELVVNLRTVFTIANNAARDSGVKNEDK